MPRIEKLDQLDQKSLGDLKLSKEEKTYLSDKTELMYNDIKEKLFLDIRAANFKLLE